MAGTNYRRGYELERAARMQLESEGWYVVRSSGSKGAADLIGIMPAAVAEPGTARVLLVQCKTDGYVPPAERKAFAALATSLDADARIASWRKDGTAARQVAMRPMELT